MKKVLIYGTVVLLLYLIYKQVIRKIMYRIRNDRQGSGEFGASRSGGTRKHAGIDLDLNMGSIFTFPKDLTFIRKAYPYKGVSELEGAVYKDNYGNELKFFYLKSSGKSAKAGEPLGIVQGVGSSYYKKKGLEGMRDHVHFEIRDPKGTLMNPNNYLGDYL